MNTDELWIKLDKYVDELVANEKMNNQPELRELYSKKDYLNLMRPVFTLLKENPDSSFEEIKEKLIQDSEINNIIKNFVDDKKMAPGIVLNYGTGNTRDIITYGNSQEMPYKKDIGYDSIFDLASTSKLFTSISILKLKEYGMIKLDDSVTKYNKKFRNLDNVSINDLLKFKTNLLTDGAVFNAKDPDEAQQILYSAYINPKEYLFNPYSDMGAMVLKNVVESVTNMDFDDFVRENIFKYLGMEDTYLNVPSEKIYRVTNENYSSVVTEDGKFITKYDNFPGTPHDRKTVAYGHSIGRAPGHAGYFSTANDMLKFADGLVNYDLLSKDSLYSISDNVVGKIGDKPVRNYGSLVYLKQSLPDILGVHKPLSGKAFMSPGFAGTELVVDPVNNITLFYGSNRLHNRIYQVHPNQRNNYSYDGEAKIFKSNNGEVKYFMPTYTSDKEVIVRKALDLALQFKFLEIIFEKEKENHLVRTR